MSTAKKVKFTNVILPGFLILLFLMNCCSSSQKTKIHEHEAKDGQIENRNKTHLTYEDCVHNSVPTGKEFNFESEINLSISGCGNNVFCSEAPNYPEDYISRKLELDPKYSNIFLRPTKVAVQFRNKVTIQQTPYSSSETKISIPLSSSSSSSISSTSSSSYSLERHHMRPVEPTIEGESLCRSNTKTIYPKLGKNASNDWQFIVNQDNFIQAVKIEECINIGEPCSFAELFPLSYKATCHQQYSSRMLWALNKDGEIVQSLFTSGSCCKCFLHRNSVF